MREIERSGLPINLDAERFLLGSVLLDGERFHELATSVESPDFGLQAHRTVWDTCCELAGRSVSIDRVTVAEELKRDGNLDRVGGLAFLLSLDEGMPHLVNLEGYCRIVREKRILRDVIRMVRQIEESAVLGTETAPELIGRAEAMVRGLGLDAARSSEFSYPGQVIQQKGGIDAYLDRSKLAGVPTGFSYLDEVTTGIAPGSLWIIGGATSTGKTTLARNMAQHAATAGYPGAYISLEMASAEIVDGMICTAGQINTQIIRRGLDFDRWKIRSAIAQVQDLPLYIRDRAGVSIPKLHAELRRMQAEKGIKFAVIDYLQLMDTVGRFGSRAEAVSTLSRGLKLIGMDLKIGMVALCQLSRGQQREKRRPELFDLRESGSIEQDADVVAFVYSEYQTQPMSEYPSEIIVAKNRGGPLVTVHTGFIKGTGTFVEREERG